MLFFAAAVAYLFVGRGMTAMAQASLRAQIIPSAIAVTIGATGFWLVATFVFGRIYCSTVCPLGTLQDSATRTRRFLASRLKRGKRIPPERNSIPFILRSHLLRKFRYSPPWRPRTFVLLIYIILILTGASGIAVLIEPWSIFESAARLTNPLIPPPASSHIPFIGNTIFGIIIAFLSLAAIWIWALFHGRRFCTRVCPIGTALESLSARSVYHIEIDPDKCINCMRCEDVCKSEAIKVAERLVDNGRCVRCFDCIAVCPNNAIRYQRNRNNRATPLFSNT